MRGMRILYIAAVSLMLVAGAVRPVAAATQADIERLMSSAALVFYGEVVSVVDLEDNLPRKSTRPPMKATVKPITVFKGSPGEEALTVNFFGARLPERPPRANLAAGEQALFFLIRPETSDAYELVDAFIGKLPWDSSTQEIISNITGGGEQKTGLVAQLRLATESCPPGGPLLLAVTIRNDGGTPVTIGTTMEPSRNLIVTGLGGATMKSFATAPAPQPRRADFVTLAPGRLYGFRIDLARYFDLRAAGGYTVGFSYASPDGTFANLDVYRGEISAPAAAFTVGK